MSSAKNDDIFIDFLNKIKKEERYRNFRKIIRDKNTWPVAKYFSQKTMSWKDVFVWCGTDYLGMSRHNILSESSIDAIKKYGVGSGGTRNIGGNYHIINELESSVADLHKKESGLVFSSGYISNFASIASLGQITNKKLIIFSDELNHASIIDGIRYSGCQKYIFKHNDSQHLRSLLESVPVESPKMIIFESVYSMNGNLGKIKEFCDLAKEFNAMTFIDEVHAIGVYGKTGAGISEILDLRQEIDIIQGSFSKGYGVTGGYITGSKNLIDSIRSAASGFIFSSTMPIMIAASCLESVEYLKKNNFERDKYFENLQYILYKFKEKNIKLLSNNSHIMSIPINNAKKAREISEFLIEEQNIYLQHINYPTVREGTERLRITITPSHTKEIADYFIDKLENALHKFGIFEIFNNFDEVVC
jgi:5-aminolevulinate synthase